MNYKEKKEKIRQEAKFWQLDFNNSSMSYSDLFYYENYFYKLAKRYGLIKELRENGII